MPTLDTLRRPACSFNDILEKLRDAHDCEIVALRQQVACLCEELAAVRNHEFNGCVAAFQPSIDCLKVVQDSQASTPHDVGKTLSSVELHEQARRMMLKRMKRLDSVDEFGNSIGDPAQDSIDEFDDPTQHLAHASSSASYAEANDAAAAESSVERRSIFAFVREVSGEHQPAADVISFMCDYSLLARLAFFMGGFATWNSPFKHRLYLVVFLASFLCCGITCWVNLGMQTVPYWGFNITLATAWFHVFGLHAWLVWRQVVKEPLTLGMLTSFSAKRRASVDTAQTAIESRLKGGFSLRPDIDRLAFVVRVFAGLLFAAQLVCVGLGYFVFPQPAVEEFAEHSDTESPLTRAKANYALTHALFMWLAIPQHVPTVVCTAGLLFFCTAMHVMDARRAIDYVSDPESESLGGAIDLDGATDLGGAAWNDLQVEACAALAEGAQLRLDRFSFKLKWLLLHQVLYAFMLLTCVIIEYRRVKEQAPSSYEAWQEFLYEVWHGLIGILLMTSALTAPSWCTKYYTGVPKSLTMAMRMRGWSLRNVSGSQDVLAVTMAGFEVFGFTISPSMTAKFFTIIALSSALYLEYA